MMSFLSHERLNNTDGDQVVSKQAADRPNINDQRDSFNSSS